MFITALCFLFLLKYLKTWLHHHAQPTFDIYHNSNVTLRVWGQNCNFFTPLPHNSQKRLEHNENQMKQRKMTRKPRSHVRINIHVSNMGYYEYGRRSQQPTQQAFDREGEGARLPFFLPFRALSVPVRLRVQNRSPLPGIESTSPF